MPKELVASPSEKLTLSSRGYDIVKQLAHGAYSVVYLAEYRNPPNAQSGIKLACKVMDTSRASKDFTQKFLPRELDILTRVTHPYITQVQNIFQRRTKYFIFMRLAENGDLLEYVMTKKVSEGQARVWLRQLALAIQYLHEMDIAHRDLKCENVLLTSNFNVKLTDFGFARFVVETSGQILISDTFCGSLSYVAPEIMGGKPYFPKPADMWSLGVILYIMLNRMMPFIESESVSTLYQQQIQQKWQFRDKVVESVSRHALELTAHLIQPTIAERWRVDQVLTSDWIAMDYRLLKMTDAEQQALDMARQEKMKKLLKAKSTTKAEGTSFESKGPISADKDFRVIGSFKITDYQSVAGSH